MKKISVLVSVFFFLLIILQADILVRIDRNDLDIVSGILRTVDITGGNMKYTDLHVTSEEYNLLKASGIRMNEIELVQTKAGFLTMDQAYAYMDSLHALYPLITDLDTIGMTVQSNPIVILKINGIDPTAENGRDAYLLMAMHHSREWQTVNLALFFADSILASYASDPDMKILMDSVFIVVLPMVNPDGYDYSRTSDTWWRKNRAFRDGLYGVDVNRNYPGGTNGDPLTDWGFIANSQTSHYPSTDIYCGPYPSSERETQAVMSLIDMYDFDITLSLHSSGEMILWPWGSVYYGAPDSLLLEAIGTEAAAKMRKQDGSSEYDAGQSVGLYPSSGDSDDWIYGWTKYVKGRTTLPFTYEVDVTFNSTTSEQLDSLLRRVFPGMLFLAQKADSIDGLTHEIPLQPQLNFSTDTLNWTLKNESEAQYYTVYHYDGPQAVMDSANNASLYNIRNFSIENARSYSGTESFKTVNLNTNCSILRPVHRWKASAGDTLSIMLWYNLETDYDKAFVELSYDGYDYFPADTVNGIFTGASSGWQNMKISLDAYAGREVDVRVRTVFDPATLNEGLYVDDFSPVQNFSSDSVFEDSVFNVFIEIPMDAYSSEMFAVMPYCSTLGQTVLSERILCSVSPVSEKMRDETEYTIYYSPQTKTLNIHLPSGISYPVDIRVYNVYGAMIDGVREDAGTDVSIDMKRYPSGKYFVNLKGSQFKAGGFLIIR